jgi:histidyl-tRNA synthetase
MNKEFLAPLSGFRDLVDPNKGRLEAALRGIFGRFGYQPLETPTLERQEILLNKFGSEAEKLLYVFEDNGGRKVGLRYDLTVPLARYVACNFNELAWPYKRFEIGTVWRADRAQKGRYRQFTQADIDIVGSDALGAEQELLEILRQVQEAAAPSLKGLVCLINDRRLVAALLEKLQLTERAADILRLLDKQDKLTEQQFGAELTKLGLSDVQLGKLRALFLTDADEALATITDLLGDTEALQSLQQLIAYGKELGLTMVFAPNMVRGLDYYTGTIIECRLPNYPSSVIGGGRYDSLVESLNGQKLPAVGISFGIDRLLDAGAVIAGQATARSCWRWPGWGKRLLKRKPWVAGM